MSLTRLSYLGCLINKIFKKGRILTLLLFPNKTYILIPLSSLKLYNGIAMTYCIKKRNIIFISIFLGGSLKPFDSTYTATCATHCTPTI